MSSSRRDENLSKNMSSIIQNSSGPYVGISQSNLIDSFIAPQTTKMRTSYKLTKQITSG